MQVIFDKVRLYWQNFSNKTRKARLVISIILLVVFVGIIIFVRAGTIKYVNQPSLTDREWQKFQSDNLETPFFTLKPTSNSAFGVLPQDTFILTTAKKIDNAFITQYLKSNVDFTITSQDDLTYEIKPKNTVKNGEAVNFSFPIEGVQFDNNSFSRDYSWAFQAQPKFAVASILPGDKKTNVPVSSGIEIVFNQDGFQDPAPLINISPSIEWRGETHGNTFAIVPQNPLQPSTIYTITLNQGLSLISRKDVISDKFTFSFQTMSVEASTPEPHLTLSRDLVQSSTQEAAGVNAYTYNWSDGLNIQTKIYRFSGSAQFISSRKKVDESNYYWYRYREEDKLYNPSNLQLVSEANLKLQTQDSASFLKLPEALPAGYYLVQFQYGDNKSISQLWLQSTDLSAYTAVGRRQTLVWANNVLTGLPVGQAAVSLSGSGLTSTSSDGVSVFDTPNILFNKSKSYLSVVSNQDELVMPVNSLLGQTSNQQKNNYDYWSYLYHERSIYKPGDTLYFWGVIKDKLTGQAPSSVDMVISNSYQDIGNNKNYKQFKTVKIIPEADGSYLGSIVLSDIQNGYYYLNLNVSDLVVSSSIFNITEYEKPELKIEVNSDKAAIFTGEKVNYTIKVSFYDGTPVKEVPFKIYHRISGDSTEVKTDKNGQIKYSYTPIYKGGTSEYSRDYPRYESIIIKPSLVNNDNLEGYGTVLVYGEKLQIDSSSSQDGKQATLQAEVNKTTLDNINQKKSYITKGDPARNQSLKLVITKTWWEKIEVGTYYDFIEKVTRKSYNYKQHDEKTVETSLITDQNGQIKYQFEMEENKSYKATLTLTDQDNHLVSSNQYYYYYQGGRQSQEDQYSSPRLTLDQQKDSYLLGDKVNLSIKYKGQDYPDTTQNKFLYILAKDGRQDYFVKDNPKFDFEFGQKNIPNVNASAIIFSGKYYQVTIPDVNGDGYYYWMGDDDTNFNSLTLRYNSNDSKIDLAISTDKTKYAPGDKAMVTVKSSKKGLPLSGTQVQLTLVDQAMEAIGGVIKPYVLEQLYITNPHQIYYNYYSHQPISYQPPVAEKGGGGGEDRQIFKDTPYFGQSKTNDQGVATFEFTLPDNLTTWLVYTQAVNSNLDAGSAESTLVVTKDFFVTSNFPSEYLLRDNAFVSLNSFGREIDADKTVNYQVKVISGDQEISSLTGQGKSSIDTSFPITQNTIGSYKVTARGQYGDLVDGLTLPFKVINSRVNLLSSQTQQLSKGKSIRSLNLPGLDENRPVKLVLSDIGYGKYFHTLLKYCYTGSNRLEKNIARYRASQVLINRFGEEMCNISPGKLSSFQNPDGGLSQVNWGGSILESTVWSVFVNPTSFDKEKLITYFENQLASSSKNSNSHKIYSLWGLSLMGRSQVSQLKALVGHSVEFNDMVVLGIALASQGETEVSREIYRDIIARYAYFNKPYFRIQSETPDYSRDTSLALLLGGMVDRSINEGLYLYLKHYSLPSTEDLLLDLSQIAFLDYEMSKLPQEESQLTINSSQAPQVIKLAKGRSKVVTIPGAESKNIDITVNSGKVEINSYYSLSSGSLSTMSKDNRLSLSRQYSPKDQNNQSIVPGSLVAVNIKYDLDSKAPAECYTITDHLPSGMSVVSNPILYGLSNGDWYQENVKNVVTYTFCNNDYWRTHDDRVFTYYAHANAVGKYLAEPAIMQSRFDLSIIQTTSEDTLTIDSLK